MCVHGRFTLNLIIKFSIQCLCSVVSRSSIFALFKYANAKETTKEKKFAVWISLIFIFHWYLFSRSASLLQRTHSDQKMCTHAWAITVASFEHKQWRQRGWLSVSEESWVPRRHIKNRLWPFNLSKPIKWTRWTSFDRYVYTLEFPALVLHIKMNNKWAHNSSSPNLSKPHFLAFTSSAQIHTFIGFFWPHVH